MKNFLFLLIVLLSLNTITAQTYYGKTPQAIETNQKVEHACLDAPFIFEGEVIAAKSQPKGDGEYSRLDEVVVLIKITHRYRGEMPDTVEFRYDTGRKWERHQGETTWHIPNDISGHQTGFGHNASKNSIWFTQEYQGKKDYPIKKSFYSALPPYTTVAGEESVVNDFLYEIGHYVTYSTYDYFLDNVL